MPEAVMPALTGDRKADWAAFAAVYRKIIERVPELRDRLGVVTLEAMVASLGDDHATWVHGSGERHPDQYDGDGYGLGLTANVVLSPGLGEPVSMLTSLAEDLASRGYVVAGIDPAYESYAMTLADGRIAECLACDSASDPGFGEEVAEGRAADVSFVLDRLPSVWRGGDRIDLSRVAMAGHLIGGAGAVAAMVRDSRVRTGVDLDGVTYARIPKGGLSRPFMFIGSDRPAGERDRTWSRDWRLLTGWKRRLVVSGAEPRSFTDYPHTAGALQPVYGTLPAARAAEITRTYVAAFLDRHLKGRRQPLPDQPSPRYPEVRFCPAACGRA
ncbi:MAG: lipase [Microbispora sp.]|nr:lipase [Microbispora sp.]